MRSRVIIRINAAMKLNSVDNPGYDVTADRIEMAKRLPKDETPGKSNSVKTEKPLNPIYPDSSLSPEKVELIIQRIKEKFYDKDEVLEEIAERMLESNEWRDFLKKVRSRKN